MGTRLGHYNYTHCVVSHCLTIPHHAAFPMCVHVGPSSILLVHCPWRLQDAEERMQSAGTSTAFLVAAEKNEAACHFYEKHGWMRPSEPVEYNAEIADGVFPLSCYCFKKVLEIRTPVRPVPSLPQRS